MRNQNPIPTPSTPGLAARERLLRARASEHRARARVEDQAGNEHAAAAQRGMAGGLQQGADQFQSYAAALRVGGPDKQRPPTKVRGIRSIQLSQPEGGPAASLIVMDDRGREFDFSMAVFADSLEWLKVGDDPKWQEWGLKVILAMSHAPDSAQQAAARTFPPSTPVNTERQAPEPAIADTVPPVDRETEPRLRERYLKRVNGHTTELRFLDDEHGEDDDTIKIGMWHIRSWLLEAGYERDYVRDDVEHERLRARAQAGDDEASTHAEALRPFPGWDDATLVETYDLAQQDAPLTGPQLKNPHTPRGHLMRAMWGSLREVARLDRADDDEAEQAQLRRQAIALADEQAHEIKRAIETIDGATDS